MPDGKAPPQVLRVQERVRPHVLGNRQSVGVSRRKVDGLSQGAIYGKSPEECRDDMLDPEDENEDEGKVSRL